MAIELASEEEHEVADDTPNERGIMDFGFWEEGNTVIWTPRFLSMCKCCGNHKHPALSPQDLFCDSCNGYMH